MPIAQGGTGGTTQVEARQNLGVGNAKIYAGTSTSGVAANPKIASCEDLPSNGNVPLGTLISVTFSGVNTVNPENLTLGINNGTASPIRILKNGETLTLPNAGSLTAGPHLFRKGNNC